MFKQGAVEEIEAEAKRYGFEKTRDQSGRPRWSLKCAGCAIVSEVARGDINSAGQLVNHYSKKGWVMARGDPPYHSTPCYRAAKASQQAKKEPAMSPPAAPLHGPQADAKVLVRVVTLLNEHFHKEPGKYDEGWSDQRVAKEADALLSFVIKYREEGYGPLAEDPEYVALREDIKKIGDQFALNATETSKRLAEVTARLDALVAKKGAENG